MDSHSRISAGQFIHDCFDLFASTVISNNDFNVGIGLVRAWRGVARDFLGDFGATSARHRGEVSFFVVIFGTDSSELQPNLFETCLKL